MLNKQPSQRHEYPSRMRRPLCALHIIRLGSSVTPIVFDRHPKAKDKAQYQQETAEIIAKACTRIGPAKPREVIVTQISAHVGAPPSFAFSRFPRKDGSERRHTHAILVFDEPVCGPILVGAGRFRGYGAFRPMNEK